MTIGVLQMLAERYRMSQAEHHTARARHYGETLYQPWRELIGFRERLLAGVAAVALVGLAWWGWR